MIRDRLVSGVNSEGIQKKLLGERDLTYERKARTLPYAMRPKVEELGRLVAEGVIEPVAHAEWRRRDYP